MPSSQRHQPLLYSPRASNHQQHSHQYAVFSYQRGIALDYCDSNKSSPKSSGKSRVATIHGRKWTRPLRVLAEQYQQQTSPVTQPRVRHIHSTVPVPHSAQPTRCKVAASRDFFLKSLLRFSKFLVNVNFDLVQKTHCKKTQQNPTLNSLVKQYLLLHSCISAGKSILATFN